MSATSNSSRSAQFKRIVQFLLVLHSVYSLFSNIYIAFYMGSAARQALHAAANKFPAIDAPKLHLVPPPTPSEVYPSTCPLLSLQPNQCVQLNNGCAFNCTTNNGMGTNYYSLEGTLTCFQPQYSNSFFKCDDEIHLFSLWQRDRTFNLTSYGLPELECTYFYDPGGNGLYIDSIKVVGIAVLVFYVLWLFCSLPGLYFSVKDLRGQQWNKSSDLQFKVFLVICSIIQVVLIHSKPFDSFFQQSSDCLNSGQSATWLALKSAFETIGVLNIISAVLSAVAALGVYVVEAKKLQEVQADPSIRPDEHSDIRTVELA